MVRTEIQVQGMTCGHCEGTVSAELAKITGVNEVKAEAASGIVTIDSAAELAQEDIAAAIEEAGYELV